MTSFYEISIFNIYEPVVVKIKYNTDIKIMHVNEKMSNCLPDSFRSLPGVKFGVNL